MQLQRVARRATPPTRPFSIPGCGPGLAQCSSKLKSRLATLAVPYNLDAVEEPVLQTASPKTSSNNLSSSSSTIPIVSPSRIAKPSASRPLDFTSRKDAVAWTRSHRYQNLVDQLSLTAYVPSAVWEAYMDLMNSAVSSYVTRDLHQQVLRKCVPPVEGLKKRRGHAVYINSFLPLAEPHPFEKRFQIVINNMRAGGNLPDIGDYNFLLEHFAATGHHHGVMRLMKEIVECRSVPNVQSFDWCFQALASRVRMKIRTDAREEVAGMCKELLGWMEDLRIHYTAPMLEAILVILRSSGDARSIEQMLVLGYGVDIRNPDRPSEVFAERWRTIVEDALAMGSLPPLVSSVSTPALNAIVAALGAKGDVSAMATAFEVLTAPLPSLPAAQIDSTDTASSSTSSPPILSTITSIFAQTSTPPPIPISPKSTPRPNTQTYEYLLEHTAAHHAYPLCRHYLLAAMEKDREMDTKLRKELGSSDPEPAWSIPVAVNARMFQHLGRLARERHDIAFIAWLSEKARLVAQWKRDDLKFYSAVSDEMLASRGMLPRPVAATWDSSAPVNPSSTVRHPFNKSVHLWLLEKEAKLLEKFHDHMEDVLPKERERLKRRVSRKRTGSSKLPSAVERRNAGFKSLRRSFRWNWGEGN